MPKQLINTIYRASQNVFQKKIESSLKIYSKLIIIYTNNLIISLFFFFYFYILFLLIFKYTFFFLFLIEERYDIPRTLYIKKIFFGMICVTMLKETNVLLM